MKCPKCNKKTDCLIKMRSGEKVCLECTKQNDTNIQKGGDIR